MNKHVIMQKILKNPDVSDSLFRKIYQFLDIVDANDVNAIIEAFREMYPEPETTDTETTDTEDGENVDDQSSQELMK